MYVANNPVNYVDPSGYAKGCLKEIYDRQMTKADWKKHMQAQRKKVSDGKMTKDELEAYRNKLSNEVGNSSLKQYADKEKIIQEEIRNKSKETSKLKTIIDNVMRQKILYGKRKTPGKNEIIGGHSPKILDHPNYAVEIVTTNPDKTIKIKYITQFEDGNLSKLKNNNTVFPVKWTDDEIIKAIKEIGNTPSIGIRHRDETTLHRGIVNGVQVEVMKIGDNVTSGYPTGGGATGLPGGSVPN